MRRTRSISPDLLGGRSAPTRTIVLWCPDWPITAARRFLAESTAPGSASLTAVSDNQPRDVIPVALIENSLVFACSPEARSEGVKRGMRVREAQARCSGLLVLDYDPALDMRSFEPVIDALEETMPGVQLVRPGTCAVRSRGPARYYGGEEEAALWILDALDELGIAGSRVGIADGPFTAERAARALKSNPQRQRITIVPEGGSAEFLGPMPVSLIGEPAIATLLRRLGIHTLGQFSRLESSDVLARFGAEGARLHALACGLDSRPVIPRVVQEEHASTVDFEPPLERIDQVAFSFRTAADRFIEQLITAKLVCTSLRIEIDSESGEFSERSWLHPRSFTAADVVDRLRWQLQGSKTSAASLSPGGVGSHGSGLMSRVSRVRVVPESVDAVGNHEQGLWGTGQDERIHHGLSRVQSMLGHGAVVTAVVGGGRTLHDRQNLIAWGDRREGSRLDSQPWPGQLPTPTPTTVFEEPRAASVLDASGTEVTIDARGILSASPATVSTDGRNLRAIAAWAGPWSIDERWWDPLNSRTASRFQVVDSEGTAWLLVLEKSRWWAEARYD